MCLGLFATVGGEGGFGRSDRAMPQRLPWHERPMAGRIFVRLFLLLVATIIVGFVPVRYLAAQTTRLPQPTEQQAPLIFSPWTKVCNKDAYPEAKDVCVTIKNGRTEQG